MFGGGAEAAEALRPSAHAASTSAPTGACEVVSAERRWTTRLVDYPGKVLAEGGAYWLEMVVPAPAGAGDGVRVVVGPDGRSVDGRITRVLPVPEDGKRVRIAVKLGQGQELEAGMDARSQTTLCDRKVVAVPAEAIHRSGNGATVVDARGATKTRAVQTGEPTVGGWIEIKSGLQAGDRVVVR